MHRLTVMTGGQEHVLAFEGEQPLQALLSRLGLALPQPCGGTGRCGKCAVAAEGRLSPPTEREQHFGRRLACQMRIRGDALVRLPERQALAQIQTEGALPRLGGPPLPGRLGAAVDVGTTTLALRLYDLAGGGLLASAAAPNPQSAVAADVMGRIQAALSGRQGELRDSLLAALERLIDEACRGAGAEPGALDSLVIAGNTTMLYLLTGRSPRSLATAPFHADHLFGQTYEVLGRPAWLPPCMHAFLGADLSCALLASGLCDRSATALLADMGTNGELALWHQGRLLVSSTAAGPAFEGVGIEMGCASLPGAIDRVWLEEGRLRAHTIGEAPAIGVCGSGLVDAVACLLDSGQVDEGGASLNERHWLSEDVCLSAADIRSLQLAKAAIAAGMRSLLHAVGTAPEQIEAFYIAGGFGSRLSPRSAARIGLIHPAWLDRAVVLGNAALSGAAAALLHGEGREKAQQIAALGEHVPLGGDPVFNEAFVEEMGFPPNPQIGNYLI